MILLWWLLACPKPDLRVDSPTEVIGEPKGVETFRTIDPSKTWEGAGLTLSVPSGWVGWEGPPEGSLLLTLSDPVTKVQFEIWSFAPSGTPGPRPRKGCEPIFRDRSDYRSVPALSSVTTATCTGPAAAAITVQGWYALHQGREIHLEAIYPSGQLFAGQKVIGELLRSLRRTSASQRESER